MEATAPTVQAGGHGHLIRGGGLDGCAFSDVDLTVADTEGRGDRADVAKDEGQRVEGVADGYR